MDRWSEEGIKHGFREVYMVRQTKESKLENSQGI